MADYLKVALLFALEREARPWLKRSRAVLRARSQLRSLWWTETARGEIAAGVIGPGETLGRKGAKWVFDQFRPDVALACGLAGALRPDLCVGDIVLGERILNRHGAISHQARSEFFSLAEQTGLHWRRTSGVTHERVTGRIEEKLELARESGADWVDMESAVVLGEAAERGIAAVAVRSISDGVRGGLPMDFNIAFDPERGWAIGKIFLQVARRPWSLPALLHLERDSRHAAVKLAEYLSVYVGCLGACRFIESGAEEAMFAEVT